MKPRRLATIDIGSNSVLLLCAERDANGQVTALDERIEITRLGRGVDRSGRLADEALAETLAAVAVFAETARSLGCEGPYATATSAARDASNGHLLVEGAAKVGVAVEIIAGEREAQLSYAAVAGDLVSGEEAVAVIDIGGGSTELILGRGAEMTWRHSYDVGSVRLTERHLSDDPPTSQQLEALTRSLKEALATVPAMQSPCLAVGIAGTFTTLATVELGLEAWDASQVHGLELSLDQLKALATRLSSMTVAARRKLPGMPEKRADVIVAGAFIAVATLEALGAGRVTIGDRGVRWGYLQEKLQQPSGS